MKLTLLSGNYISEMLCFLFCFVFLMKHALQTFSPWRIRLFAKPMELWWYQTFFVRVMVNFWRPNWWKVGGEYPCFGCRSCKAVVPCLLERTGPCFCQSDRRGCGIQDVGPYLWQHLHGWGIVRVESFVRVKWMILREMSSTKIEPSSVELFRCRCTCSMYVVFALKRVCE